MIATSPLTQNTYRLWARIGAGLAGSGFNSTPGMNLVTNSDASVTTQLAGLLAASIAHETP